MKVVRIFMLGALFIIIGLGVQMIQYQEQIDKHQEEIKEYKKQIKELDKKVLDIAREKLKLENENQYLWSNYYMNVTNYEGYEYYE